MEKAFFAKETSERKRRKAQASVIVLILIVLIAIVAILIVWNLVTPLIKNKSEEVGLEKLTTNLEIKEAVLFVTGASKITVFRGSGKGDITALKFVFYDENGNSKIAEEKTKLAELGTEIYSFSPFSTLGKIKKISVFPVFGEDLGMEDELETNEIIEIPRGLVSWWRMDDEKDFIGKNNCAPIEIVEDGKRGKVASFNGEPAACGRDVSLDIDKEIGISFWIKTSSENGEVMKKGDNYNVFLENGAVIFNYGKKVKSEDNINNNEWHHVVATMTGIYVDGELSSSKIMDYSGEVNSEALEIGRFNGLLDEVMLFNEPLANIEVSGIYNNQKIG